MEQGRGLPEERDVAAHRLLPSPGRRPRWLTDDPARVPPCLRADPAPAASREGRRANWAILRLAGYGGPLCGRRGGARTKPLRLATDSRLAPPAASEGRGALRTWLGAGGGVALPQALKCS